MKRLFQLNSAQQKNHILTIQTNYENKIQELQLEKFKSVSNEKVK